MNPTMGLQGRIPLALVHDYYAHQAGGGVGSVFAGQRYQRGHGLGSFFAGLFRSAMPLITRGLKALGRQALSTGGEVLSDVMQGEPLKASFAARSPDGAQILGGKLKRKIDEYQSGAGGKRLKLYDSSSYMMAGTRKHPQFFARKSRGLPCKTRSGGRIRKKVNKRKTTLRRNQPKKKKKQKWNKKQQKKKRKKKKKKKKKQKKVTKRRRALRKIRGDIFD